MSNDRISHAIISAKANIAGLIFLLALSGCEKKDGLAVIIGKEHVAAMEAEKTESPARSQDTDPRAVSHEQWIINVRMVEDGRKIDVRVDQAQWEKAREGDRVHVKYQTGKYTGTVWAAEIE